MSKLNKIIERYKDDAYHFDDFDDSIISEVLNKLNESLSTLEENDNAGYAQTIKEYQNSLKGERKEVMKDFIEYSKHYNK
jgi:hypothetical protein